MSRKGKKTVISDDVIDRAKAVIGKLPYGDELLMALSVLLTGKCKLKCEEVGSILGVSVPTVIRMNGRFRKGKTIDSPQWGGDRRSILTPEIEREILADLETKAHNGQIILASQVQSAIEAKINRKISLQTAYNVLYRNGWRKVMPDKEHPRGDKEKREEFKKKLFPRRWKWLPSEPSIKIVH